MVSDQEIASCVQSLLRQLGPGGVAAPVNVNGVVQQLEAKLGLDLSHKAGFIRDQINLLLRPSPPPLHPQQQHLQQQQFLAVHPQQVLQHGQIPASPFTHLPSHHELAFQRPSAGAVQGQQVQAQQTHVTGGGLVAKQEVHLASGSAAPAGAKESAVAGSKRKGGSGGLNKLCGVSPELQVIVGEPTMPRTQIVKELWAYIRRNNLQDPSNKRKIICNDELRLVFETDSTDMFKMNKLLSKHIIPLEQTKDQGSHKKKLKPLEVDSAPKTDGSQTTPARVLISEELARFFGSGEKEMLQTEVLKRVWDYIDVYNLKDPLNPKMVRCDAQLQQLFGCESLSALGISEMLGRHLFKQS